MSVATALPALEQPQAVDAGLISVDADSVQLPRRLRAVPSEPPLDQEWEPVDAATLLPFPVPLHASGPQPLGTPPAAPPPAASAPTAVLSVPRPSPTTALGTARTKTPARRTHKGMQGAPGQASDGELARLFGPEPTPRSALPDPRLRAAHAVRILLEVLCGDRPTRQVAGLVSPAILERLEHRHPSRFRAEPRRCELRSLHVSEPADCVAEVAAVVFAPATRRGQIRARCRAVALRLEGADGRWTVTAFTVG